MNEARKHRDQARTLLLSTILADLKNREFELQHPPSDDETADVLAARHQASPGSGRAVRRRRTGRSGRRRAGGGEGARGIPSRGGGSGRNPPRGARSDRRRGARRGQGHGAGDAQVQGPGGWQGGEPDRAGRAVGRSRAPPPRGVASAVRETLELPAALERVAEHAAGPLGAARVRSRRPVADVDAVRAALAQVAELAALLLRDDDIRAEPVPDIGPALELLAVAGSVLEGAALAGLGRALVAARIGAADLGRLAAQAPRTAALRVAVPARELETRLAQSLDPEGQVLDGASRGVARARRDVREARQRLVQRLESILGALDQSGRAPDAAVTLRGGRYVIPVRGTAWAKVGGIVHDESATGSTLFVEPPDAIGLGNALREHEAEEQREVLQVLRDLTELLRPVRETIAAAWEMCIAFDDLCARARYAVLVNGFAPAIGTGPLEIHDGRHPLLISPFVPPLHEVERGKGGAVVPFYLILASDEFTVLVSGPNTGGKTVLIKAVGLLCLMAQSGIVPPIGPQSTLPAFGGVFADIGDRQSIAASLSTFSAHVAVLKDILERAQSGSLVLLDEIGSGTDPAEGAALAAAVLKTLTRRRAVTLEARERELAVGEQRVREDAARVDVRGEEVAGREREVKARARGLEQAARDQTRAYLLEARKKVEEALGRARAAVDEATAKQARRLLEQALEETAGETAGEKAREGWGSLEQLRSLKQPSPTDAPRRVPI